MFVNTGYYSAWTLMTLALLLASNQPPQGGSGCWRRGSPLGTVTQARGSEKHCGRSSLSDKTKDNWCQPWFVKAQSFQASWDWIVRGQVECPGKVSPCFDLTPPST